MGNLLMRCNLTNQINLKILKRKEKKKQKKKKEKSSPTIVLYGNDSHEDYTKNFFPHRFSSAKIPRRGIQANVINLKRPLNGKQNVWKYQNGEEKSDSDGREKDV